jgi:hypothetical protein
MIYFVDMLVGHFIDLEVLTSRDCYSLSMSLRHAETLAVLVDRERRNRQVSRS